MGSLRQLFRQGVIATLKRFDIYRKAYCLPAGVVSFYELDKKLIVYEFDEPPVTRKLPVTIGEVHHNFKNKLKSSLSKTFVVKGQNWKVWGNQGAVLTDTDVLFKDVSREFDDEKAFHFQSI